MRTKQTLRYLLCTTIAVALGSIGSPALAGAAGGGSIDKDAVQAAIRAIRPQVKQCYEHVRALGSSEEGTMVVSFTLVDKDGRGEVAYASVPRSDIKNQVLTSCVVMALAQADLPAPTGGPVRVSYPFQFAASR